MKKQWCGYTDESCQGQTLYATEKFKEIRGQQVKHNPKISVEDSESKKEKGGLEYLTVHTEWLRKRK